MLSLLTIYSANAISLSLPETNNAFGKTREALRSLYYTLSKDPEGGAWWQNDSYATKEHGGMAGLKMKFDSNTGTKGPSMDYLGIAMRTVPILARGMADYMDPHYKLVSKLTDYGGLPTGKTWASVPVFWPVNFFGWGPPLTGWGAMAYGMPQLRGDKKAAKKGKINEKAEAASSGSDVCAEETE